MLIWIVSIIVWTHAVLSVLDACVYICVDHTRAGDKSFRSLGEAGGGGVDTPLCRSFLWKEMEGAGEERRSRSKNSQGNIGKKGR